MTEHRTFLSYVAEDLIKRFGHDLAHVTVVFPNKRAALFLNQEIARQAGRAIWSPSYITISELFRSQCTWQVADPIKAVCDLYRTYIEITGSAETLDKFYGWGQVLLADFDDIDKNMADVHQVFKNVTDLHEMDDLSYLTEAQKELISRFFANFPKEDANSLLRQRFVNIWSRLADVYKAYRKRLSEQNLAYEGMLYRQVADKPVLNLPYKHYVFVGFNVLQQVEQVLFKRLQHEGKATFYWNYDQYYMANKNEAGVYIEQWLDRFPNALDKTRDDIFNNLSKKKQISFVSAPTEDIQARYVTTWLRENNRYKDGARTAIVLADESLLDTVIHCIPPEIGDVNITTGYPLSQTPIATLVAQLINVQLRGYNIQRDAFRLHEINRVFRHPYAEMLSPKAKQIREELNNNHRFYPNASEIPFLILPEGENYTEQLTRWLKDCVEAIAKSDKHPTNDPLFEESVFRMFTLLSRLHDLILSGDLCVDKVTLQRLLQQLIQDTNIPFHGKPAIGVQIMGVLETRNLDFDHILVLSCNEGNLPRGVDDTSFIPHALRKAYGLTTIDNKVAIYSYYFNSLLQRAKDVTLAYNTSADGTGGGSMSRFMLQLLTETNHPIRQIALLADQKTQATQMSEQEKNEPVMQKLDTIKTLSPSALITYLKCSKMFFYKYVLDFKESEDEDEDTIDNRLFGNIFHRAAQLIYETLLPHDLINREDIESLLKREDAFNEILNQAFNEELFKLPEGTKRMPTLNGLQLINREVIEKYLRRLLRIDLTLTPFQVIAHEAEVESEIFHIGKHDIRIKGRIDRLDRINIGESNECLRVVDYKTGSSEAKDMSDVHTIFTQKGIETNHGDYVMQAMAYSLIVARHADNLNPLGLPVRPALFFIQRAANEDYDPTLTIAKNPITNITDYEEEFTHEMKTLLEELFNPENAFIPEGSEHICTNCPYKKLCGEVR